VKLVVKTIIVILCRVSDCEELVGVTHRRWWGWFFWVFQSIFFYL